ncbi:hypothetical protein DM813_17970 [Pseudomonas alkylphenolica]|uniref:HEAT repeat domain-containing protein n=1 Tax=Pseudomonas alkylphenolica TaxID=237609 RepID=A0A443ZPQ1_9PSED|nr:hypothetical protein [Pseudomonas alkylphenolica]RWU21091.1 hypothetical protein DM813_17970 [Pseudomonas alkylphenolica]
MATPFESIQQLIKTMNGSSSISTEMKAAAAEGLGYAGGADARAALIRVINGSSSIAVEVKTAAAKALGHAASR